MKANDNAELRFESSFMNVKLVKSPLSKKKLSTEKVPFKTIENEKRLNI